MAWYRSVTAAVALLALAGVVVVGAACGGDDSGGSKLPAGTFATAASGVTVPAGAPEIDQNDLTFKPDKVTVKAGDKVYFRNSESTIHTVTIEGKNISGSMKKGEVAVWTAASAGTYKVTCDYHPQMRATITVQ